MREGIDEDEDVEACGRLSGLVCDQGPRKLVALRYLASEPYHHLMEHSEDPRYLYMQTRAVEDQQVHGNYVQMLHSNNGFPRA